MTYDEVLAQVLELLQRDKRVAYRVLKRRLGLDDEYVEDLKADLIKAKRLAFDEDGEVLVWAGGTTVTSSQLSVASYQLPVTSTQHPTPDPQAEAEECFLKAIEIAREQQAKSLELRAVMSLVRLWQRQGKRAEAHQLLSEIYHWFTEGFDTKDLQEAKALLEELNH